MASPKKEIGKEVNETAKELREINAAAADLMRCSTLYYEGFGGHLGARALSGKCKKTFEECTTA